MYDAGTVKYQKANEAKYVASPLQKFLLTLKTMTKVHVMLAYELCLIVINAIRGVKSESVKGQLCLVTGGVNGLGYEIAKRFAKEGCNIAIADVVSSDNAVRDIVDTYGVKCRGYKCDVSDIKSIESMKSQVEAELGLVDILVNNAGLLYMSPVLSGTIDDIKKCIAVNLTSHFMTVKSFLPGMIERKRGRIVAIASISAKISLPLGTAYTATKYGVDGFMEALYDDLCVENQDEFIKLSTVYPYFINTRKELGDILDILEDPTPRLTPEFVADETVKRHLQNQRSIIITPLLIHRYIHQLPDKVRKYLKMTSMNVLEAKKNLMKQVPI